MNAIDYVVLVGTILGIAVLWMGLYPKPFTDVMNASVDGLLQHVSISKLPKLP